MAVYAFYDCKRVRPLWDHVGEVKTRIDPEQLVLLDVGYVVDNSDPPKRGEKQKVYLTILMVWTTWMKALYEGKSFSHLDLIILFRHQLTVKIRCDGRNLDHITFSKRWMTAASLVVRKGTMLESSFPLLAYSYGCQVPVGPHFRQSRKINLFLAWCPNFQP